MPKLYRNYAQTIRKIHCMIFNYIIFVKYLLKM